MTPQHLADFAETLPGCRRTGPDEPPAWYVADRLVCRLESPTRLTVWMSPVDQEHFVAGFPDVFGVAGSAEGHDGVRVDLDVAGRDPRGDDAVRLAVRAAYLEQRGPGSVSTERE